MTTQTKPRSLTQKKLVELLTHPHRTKRPRWYLMPFLADGFSEDVAMAAAASCLICSAEIEEGKVVVTHTGMGDMAEPVSLPSKKIELQNGLITISGDYPRVIVSRQRLLATIARSEDPDVLRTAIALWCEARTISYVRKYPQLDDRQITIDFLGGGGLSISADRERRLKLVLWTDSEGVDGRHSIQI